MHADGNNQTNITNNPARDIDPAWSPDGKKIAFVSTRISGKPYIFSMNPDGSNVTQLTDGIGHGFFFVWSPDGKKIAYVTYSDDPNIYTGELIVIDADGKNKTILTNKIDYDYESFIFGWSPDSQYLVYRLVEGENSPGLYVANADGSNQIEWADLSYIDHIHWLDNKNFVAYSRFWWDPGKGQKLIQILSTDGSRTEFPVSETTIAATFDKTYITQSQDGLSWFTFYNALIASFPFYRKCDDSIWDTYFSLAPDKKSAFVTAFCSNTTSFFIVNDDGTIAQQIGDTQYDYVETTKAGWSPDGKYVAKVISYLTPNFKTEEDIYLFDIQRSLKDPSLQPMRLTTDGAIKNWGPIWQPIP
jgi:Tol biopolymer transport system component